MRERITFVHGAEAAFNPSQLIVDKEAVRIESLKAAREDRLTFSIAELPQELYRVLKQCHELHIRWTSQKAYTSIEPFVARASPGLHVFFTPNKNRTTDLLCPQLTKIFGDQVKCLSPEKSFIGLPRISERFATSAALQYYTPLTSLKDLVTYVEQKICSISTRQCSTKATLLDSVDYLNIDYDAISQSLILAAFHSSSPRPGGWTQEISKLDRSAEIEVGILAPEIPKQPEELSFGGFLTVLGEDLKAKATLFSFPSRHHALSPRVNDTYVTRFVAPTGLHPTLQVMFPSSLPSPKPSCALHTYITLPSYLFPDKYQLSSSNLLSSKNLKSIRSLAGETDLEAPDWVISKWGSSMLLELAPPANTRDNRGGGWNADIPLHLRYLQPNVGDQRIVEVPWPVVFWACPAEEGTKMSTNPFDRVNLGYEGLFGPRTMFYHLVPGPILEKQSLVENLQVPVLSVGKVGNVEMGTVAVVMLGTLWLVAKLVQISTRDTSYFTYSATTQKAKKL